jgi:hypothetical protein
VSYTDSTFSVHFVSRRGAWNDNLRYGPVRWLDPTLLGRRAGTALVTGKASIIPLDNPCKSPDESFRRQTSSLSSHHFLPTVPSSQIRSTTECRTPLILCLWKTHCLAETMLAEMPFVSSRFSGPSLTHIVHLLLLLNGICIRAKICRIRTTSPY